MIKAQKRLIIIIAVLVCVLAALYFAVLAPMLATPSDVVTDPPVTVEGEIIGNGGRYQLFEQVARADMKSIEITNTYGTYKFVRAGTSFYIDGVSDAKYDPELFSQLVVDCGYTLASMKVGDNITDLEKYGLDAASAPASFTVTTLSGKVHKVWIGNRITTGGGYYAMYDGRSTVYALAETLGDTVLQPIEAFVSPQLAYETSLSTYFLIENFTIFKGEEQFASFRYLEENERNEQHTFSPFLMMYPGEGVYCPSDHLDTALQNFVTYSGSEVVKLSPKQEDINQYFPNGYVYSVYLVSKVPKDSSDYSKGFFYVENFLFFSERHVDRDGSEYYYCYSPMFKIVAKIEAHKAEFIEWDLKMWVHDNIYQCSIDSVKEMQFVLDDGETVTFDLTGLGQDLVVTVKETGFKPNVKNFRQLYKTLLSITKESAHGLTDSELESLFSDEDSRQLTMNLKLRSGKTVSYQFHNYSDRRTCYSQDGVNSEFYVLRTMVNKIADDVLKVTRDETVNSEDKH